MLFEFQCGSQDASAEFGEVVFVAVADFFDQAMGTQAFEQVGRLRGRESLDMCSQVPRPKAADGPFASKESDNDLQVLSHEKVEAAIGAVIVFGRAGYFIAVFEAGCGVIDIGDKGQVALIGGTHQLSQSLQTVDCFS